MTESQVRKEMSILPLTWIGTIETLPRQHIVRFQQEALGSFTQLVGDGTLRRPRPRSAGDLTLLLFWRRGWEGPLRW